MIEELTGLVGIRIVVVTARAGSTVLPSNGFKKLHGFGFGVKLGKEGKFADRRTWHHRLHRAVELMKALEHK